MADETKKGGTLILLIDDEQDILDLYGATLKNAGFETITATNGPDGLKLAKEKKPGLILLDFKMPEMDGVEVLERLRKDPDTKDLRVVFVSAFGDPIISKTDSIVAQELTGVDFMRKGLGLEEFVTKVKSYLR